MNEQANNTTAATEERGPAGTLAAALQAVRLYAGWALLLALTAALYTLALLNLGAQDALAAPGGGGGGGDAIIGTINNVRDYFAGALLSLGGLGFVGSLGLKAASPVNENAQYLAHMGIKSSFIAVLAGAIVGPVMSIVQGLAA